MIHVVVLDEPVVVILHHVRRRQPPSSLPHLPWLELAYVVPYGLVLPRLLLPSKMIVGRAGVLDPPKYLLVVPGDALQLPFAGFPAEGPGVLHRFRLIVDAPLELTIDFRNRGPRRNRRNERRGVERMRGMRWGSPPPRRKRQEVLGTQQTRGRCDCGRQ